MIEIQHSQYRIVLRYGLRHFTATDLIAAGHYLERYSDSYKIFTNDDDRVVTNCDFTSQGFEDG